MLCHSCRTAIQAATKRFRRTKGLPNSDVRPRLNSSFLHLSHRDFRHSIAAGCYVCRSIENGIPTSGDVQLQIGDENAVAYFMPFRLLRNITARTVNSTIQHVLIPLTIYTGSHLSKKLLNMAQQWCTKRYLFWISVDPSLEIKVRLFGFKDYYNILPGLRFLYGPDNRSVQLETHICFFLSPAACDGIILNPQTDSKPQTRSHWTGDSSALWHYWLNTCVESHPTCRSIEQSLQTYSPKRLVEVLLNNNGGVSGWKLAHSSSTGTVPYFTLSHCWGSYLPLRLTKDNIRSLSNSSSIDDLPKTYQDALTVVNSLGYKYIWIDSLCIVQDDEQDWENESSLMGLTYNHAVCNIAATWASNGEDGCFSIRDPTTICPTFIALDLTDSGRSTYQISQSDVYHGDITHAPLNKRGWVVQERYLARRQLSATKRQFYWECHDLLASEEFPHGYPADRSPGSEWPWLNGAAQSPQKPCLGYNGEKKTRQDWAALVELYSSCHLTRVSDKLAALSGVANQLQHRVDDIYMFGLWKKDIHQQLCWDHHPMSHTPRRTTQGIIAPTWSWANFDGRVRFDHAYYGTYRECASWIQVVDTPGNSTKKLTLRGLALKSRLVWVYREEHPGWGRHETYLSMDGLKHVQFPEASSKLVVIRWDEEISEDDADSEQWSDLKEQRNSDLLFLVINSARSSLRKQICGLVLRRLPPSADNPVLYCRMGTFRAEEDRNHVLEHLASHLNFHAGDTKDPLTAELTQNVAIV